MSLATANRVLFLSHGGGPLPLLGDPGHREMRDTIAAIAELPGRPAAIVVVSAHWEEADFTVTGGEAPDVIYDYYGFPEESYRIRYPAPGAPPLAREIRDRLANHGLDAHMDTERGFDHGLFVPLLMMYPQADIPCVQVSLRETLDAADHIALGEALSFLASRDVLLVGSGFSFHNLRAFFKPATAEIDSANHAFEGWLAETLSPSALSESQRREHLLHWQQAPGALLCHPRAEHLMPLHVCYGAAGRAAGRHFSMEIMGRRASAFLW